MQELDSNWQFKYCRTCASELVTGVHIFGNEGKRLGISEKLRKTLSVLVLEEDLLPKRICTDCCLSLEEFSQYKETVFDAQEKLRGIAKTLIGKKDEVNTLQQPPIRSPSASTSSNNSNKNGVETQKKEYVREDDAVEGEPIASHADDSTDPEVSAGKVTDEPPASFPCDFCDDVFTIASAYYSHIATIHKGKRYECSFCSISYAQKASLVIHIRTHHSPKDTLPPKSHLCTVCPAAFFEKKDLTRHAKTHITDRVFPCYICNKFYKTSKCLSKHISTHLSMNKFVCTVCQKGFNRKNRLAEHENTHSNSSSLGCPFCIKTFNNYPNYLKHVRRMHEHMCTAGDKAPAPVKNSHVDPTTSSPESVLPSTSSTVASVWVENVPVSRQAYHGANSLEVVNSPTLQSNTGNSSVSNNMAANDDGNNSSRDMAAAHDPNQPMELCYNKITSTSFQDMPMELTKVFQESGPLELCVRTETELGHFIDPTSNNHKEPHSFNTKLDLIDLSNVNVAPFQQQPMDLINRDSYSCCNLTSVNNSMDLSLRSSFSDQSTNSFIRELLDLSSRSEGYHLHHDPHHPHSQMELNLSSTKHPQPYRSAPAPAPHPTTNSFLNVYPDNLF